VKERTLPTSIIRVSEVPIRFIKNVFLIARYKFVILIESSIGKGKVGDINSYCFIK
jgi:hypothetical protein